MDLEVILDNSVRIYAPNAIMIAIIGHYGFGGLSSIAVS